jgi:hypothetical protein
MIVDALPDHVTLSLLSLRDARLVTHRLHRDYEKDPTDARHAVLERALVLRDLASKAFESAVENWETPEASQPVRCLAEGCTTHIWYGKVYCSTYHDEMNP